jgi:asparagine synthase (glutamine-hydrolysing)
MCGIVGLIHSRNSVAPELIRSAARTLYKRGPDDSGVWTSKNVGLGHRRLAILDLTPSARQPMFSSDGRYVIVFNGEIYNFGEIKRCINGFGACWRSQSDTEVILRAYSKWGPECLQRFHGMFAFAIWDRTTRVLFAARDRMGVKPFYYHHSGEAFAFASRPRALLALNPGWSSPFDEQALRLYLECGFVPAPFSIYRAIRKLPPAHWLLATEDGLRIERYWDFCHIAPEPSWEDRREEDLLDELDQLISRCVRSRMISDVPLGAFLSGGIDSSLVVALMAKHSTQRVKTFTIGFAEKDFDESSYAYEVSREIRTEHHCEHLKVNDLLDLLPTFSKEYDEPFSDSSAFPTMAVSRCARRQVTVSLSGDGGDELFGGYRHYRIARALDRLYKAPTCLRRTVAWLLGMVPRHRFQLISGALGLDTITDALHFSRSIIKDFDGILPDLLRRTTGMRDLLLEASENFPPGLSAPEKAMRLDACFTLPDDYLQKVDVATMAFSLESREPLLDQDLVEWTMKLPLKWKLRGNQCKYLLRKLACRYVPRHTTARPKMGFEVPVANWLRGPLRKWAEAELQDQAVFEKICVDHAKVLAIYNLQDSGKRKAHSFLWSLLMLSDFAKRGSRQEQQFIPATAHDEMECVGRCEYP